MKHLIKQIALALVVASLAAASVVAKTRKESISFSTNTTVNGTLVKKGDYELKFDDEKSQLAIVKDGKVVAQANTSTAKRGDKARMFALRFSRGGDRQLIGFTFAGADQDIVIDGSSASR